ncbi:nuclease [Geomonas terrae]|uniref:Nuclease n=2 Tax=Geomonas terrae TaxID=2562681 RepID=A0A4S1CFF7_9BACT|nr:nuclease [Geomonas terrae]
MVTKASDGDTIRVLDPLGTKLRVRLYGIDAPETEKASKRTGRISKVGQAHGDEAWKALTGKVLGQRVKLDVMGIDRYKRLVCLVWLGSRNVNKEMVAEGWAWAYRHYLDTPYASEFIAVEETARQQHLGLWKTYNPQPPWEFRRVTRTKKGIGNDHF